MSTETKDWRGVKGPLEFRTYGRECVVVSTRYTAPGGNVRLKLKGVTITVDARVDDDQSNAGDVSQDGQLTLAAMNAMLQISPDNPLAAARSLASVVAAAKDLAIDAQVRGHGGRPGITTTTALIAALSLLDGGAR